MKIAMIRSLGAACILMCALGALHVGCSDSSSTPTGPSPEPEPEPDPTYTVSGRILDGRHDQVVVSGAKVCAGTFREFTADDGHYAFTLPEPGAYTVAVDAGEKYSGQSHEVTVDTDNQEVVLDIRLEQIAPVIFVSQGRLRCAAGCIGGRQGFIDSSGPTLFESISDTGRGDHRDSCLYDEWWEDAYAFDLRLTDGWSPSAYVSEELGSQETARNHARGLGQALGRVPAVLRSNVGRVCLFSRSRSSAFRGGPGRLLYPLGEGDDPNDYDDITLHEGTHASLDGQHADSPGWRAAQQADGTYITEYAAAYPGREDLAETFPAYFLVKYSPDGHDPAKIREILLGIPNRLAYLDARGFAMDPWAPVGSLEVPPGHVYGRGDTARSDCASP